MGKFDKIKKLRIGNYFRELSTVVIGVAITLFLNNIISGVYEKRDLNLHLNAIYAESEYNLERLDGFIRHHERHNRLRGFLLDYFYNPSPYLADSIRKYKTVYTNTTSFNYKKSAYNMFVNSGVMKLLTDRNLLLNITEVYTMLEELSKVHEGFMESQNRIFHDGYKLSTKEAFDTDILAPHMQSTYNFHALHEGLDKEGQKIKKEVEKLLSHRK